MIKSIIYGLHLIIILQNKFICIQTKNFLGCYTLRIIYIYKNHVYFVGSGFLGSHRKLHTPSNTFTSIHRWGSCLTSTNEFFFTRGGVYSCLLLPDMYFILLFHITVQPYWMSSHCTWLTQSNTTRSVDYNHALTPIQCDVPVHMQCNVPLHVITCHIYAEYYIDNLIHSYILHLGQL